MKQSANPFWTGGRWLLLGVLFTGAGAWPAAAADGDRELGTIGPPPPKNPQRETAAEALAPSIGPSLPSVTLRRSEPKAEPQAPLFAGKLTYGTYQDYMPNPGDLDNLMRHIRGHVGLWYGQRLVTIEEVVAGSKAGRPCQIPLLYVTGYHPVTWTDEQRAALADYVASGGALLGDATLGSPSFTASFIKEVRAMFPKRQFDILQVDHPIFRAFYRYGNINYFEVERGWEETSQGPPRLLGMNIGTRTAVILSPYDLTCGWDGFYAPASSEKVADAPRTKALVPGDAIRLGINIVSYVAALRHVAEVEAVTREFQAPADRFRQQFTVALLRHNGDWNPDPNSVYQWLRHLANESSLAVGFALKQVDPVESQLAPYPFLFMTGFRDPQLSDAEVTTLRNHLQAGGFLFINNCSGYGEFDHHGRVLLHRMFPDQDLAPIPADHALRHSLYNIKEVRDRRTGSVRPLELLGLKVNNRLVVVYSPNDAITQLKQVSDPFGNGYDAESCRQLAINVVAYALQN
ncbi:DUF4159 domain-containing protein [bacterium]|nr:DUF4159 domain-containing protein [bacterium]